MPAARGSRPARWSLRGFFDRDQQSNHPPAEPGAFENVSRSKRLSEVANAAPILSGHLEVAHYFNRFICSKR